MFTSGRVMKEPTLLETQRAVRARANAIPRPDAPVLEVDDLELGGLALGIVAPPAVQGASLEEDRRADPRAVVEREPHDVEDETDRSGGRR
jgi:hypothetical protein